MPRGDARKATLASGVELDRPIRCPAGAPFGGADGGCFCRIEGSPITSLDQPSTLTRYCQGSYMACPTWRAAKEAHWQHRAVMQEYAPRSRRTVLDEDPERRTEFSVPR